MTTQRFLFKTLDRIGYPDALEDVTFLADCFVDSGYLSTLEDCGRPERIVLGRTGAGKSALLERLYETQNGNARRFDPTSLSLSYVSNSTILRFLKDLGVNFDLFFNLLWKHVFAVELIRWRYNIRDEGSQRTVFDNFKLAFKPKEREALEYLQQFGNKFWIESDERVVAITSHIEQALRAGLGLESKALEASAELKGHLNISEVRRREIRERAQHIIGQVQAQHLNRITDLVQRVLDDPARRWYILVDKLDENWVDDRIKAQLIRALLDVTRSFFQISNLKIIVALRHDLIDRVFAEARGSGAQREKYHGIFLDVQWKKRDLIRLLDLRVSKLVRSRFTGATVTSKDILPKNIGKQPALDWLIERTLLRPRDLIAFLNACIINSDNQPVLSADTIRASESTYSRGRLDAVLAEWEIDYPNLNVLANRLLKARPTHFSLSDVTDEDLYELSFEVLAQFDNGPAMGRDDDISLGIKAFEISGDSVALIQILFAILFRVGIVGVKISKQLAYVWSYSGERTLAPGELTLDTRVKIHECFYRSLATRTSMTSADALDPLLV